MLWMPRSAVTPGGHLTQMRETARALAALGCEVTEAPVLDPSFSGVDIVHGFDLNAEQIRSCREAGLPVVISTIYWDLRYRYDGPPGTPSVRALLGRAVRSGRFAMASLRGRGALVEACLAEASIEFDSCAQLSSADMLLPNSEGEARSLQREARTRTPYRVVPNGVDPDRYSPGPGTFESRDTVLFAGRVEPHKNQLGLLEALRDTGLRLVLAYLPHRDHAEYLKRCFTAAEGWADLVEDPSPEQLVALYRSARVHVLPSWFETTGLVSLEAGLCGCNVVSTDRGHAREYLDDLAWYCDPAVTGSIRSAVLEAWDSPPRPALRERILSSYTWEHVARATLDAYREVLARRT
jgi:glycosyltransferase involved in cell wall biosynthesis